MSKEIIYSFKEYQEKYPLTLAAFCKNTEFDEFDFITTEIENYNIFLTSLIVYKRIKNRMPGDTLLNEDQIFLNTNCISYDFIIEDVKNKAISEGLHTTNHLITNYKIHFNKIISFLESKKTELETELKEKTINIETPLKQLQSTLNWQGTPLEFSEFTKALIESGFIGKVKNEKEVFEKMKQFFNVKDFDKSDKLKQVRNRTKDLTPAINTLEISLMNWIKRKD